MSLSHAQQVVCWVELQIEDVSEQAEEEVVVLPTGLHPHKLTSSVPSSNPAIDGSVQLQGSLPEGVYLYEYNGSVSEPDLTELITNGLEKTLPTSWTASDTKDSQVYYLVFEQATDEFTITMNLGGNKVGHTDDEVTLQGACGGCTSQSCAAGAAQADVGPMDFQMGLGATENGHSAGNLRMFGDRPSAAMATPDGLMLTRGKSVTVNRDGNGRLTSIVMPDGRMDVQIDSAYQYRLKFRDRLGNKTRDYIIKNPDGAASINRLQIYEDGESNKAWAYVWDEVAETWTLDRGSWQPAQGEGSAVMTQRERVDYVKLVGVGYEKVRTMQDPVTAAVLSKVVERYQRFAWGEEMTRRVVDPDGAALTSEWGFYDDAGDTDNYGQLRWMKDASGGWEYYLYQGTTEPVRTIRQRGNNVLTVPADAAAVDALAQANVEILEDDYSMTLNGTDNVRVRVEIERVYAGGVVSDARYRYEIEWEDAKLIDGLWLMQRWDVQCITVDPIPAGGTVTSFIENLVNEELQHGTNSAGHMITKTYRIPPKNNHGAAQANAFKTKQVLYPDGRTTIYEYNGLEMVTTSGMANATKDGVTEGTRTTRVVDSSGNAVSTQTEHTDDGTTWETLSLSKTLDRDNFNRPTQTGYYYGNAADLELDPATEGQTPLYDTQVQYGCCGVDWRIDRRGLKTRYEHDALGRVYLTEQRTLDDTQTFAATYQVYDAAGRVIATYRAKVEDPAAPAPGTLPAPGGDWLRVSASEYDLSGRMIRQTDAGGKDTFYVYRKVGPDGTAYDDQVHSYFYEETRVYPHRNSDANWTAPPVQVTWTNSQGNTIRSWSASSGSGAGGGGSWNAASLPDGSEMLTELTRMTYVYNWANRQVEQHAYHDLAGLALADAGVESTNFYKSQTIYDVLGRMSEQIDAQGNITKQVYDARGRQWQTWVGIDPQNLVQVSEVYYDTNRDGTGDDRSYITRRRTLKPVLTTLTDFRSDSTYVDYEQGLRGFEDWYGNWEKPAPGAGPWILQVRDGLNRQLFYEVYKNGMLTEYLAFTEHHYDDFNGRPFRLTQSVVGEVENWSTAMSTRYAYDNAERQVKVTQPSGVFTKTEFNALGRVVRTATGTDEGATDDATNFIDDTLVSEVVYGYDDAGNMIWTETYDRQPGATATGLLSAAASDQRRVTYTATWYDDAHRPTHQANYGDQTP